MKFTNIKKKIFLFIIFTLSLTMVFVSVIINSISYNKEKTLETEKQNGYFNLSDKYDNEIKNIWDFYKKSESLSILSNTYNKLVNNQNLSYYEFSYQPLEFIGDYNGDFSFVDGLDETFINQTVNDKKITPLYSLQLSSKIIDELNLKDKLMNGRIFNENEYELSDDLSVPVIMGNHYKKYFQINDSFNAGYVGEVVLNCKVIGFFEEDLEINLANTKYDMNKYIVFPLLNINMNKLNDNLDTFYKILLTTKSEGYIYYDNLDNKMKEIDEIQNISNSTGFEYNLENLINENQSYSFWPISCNTSLILMVISSILFIFIVFLLMYNYKKKSINNISFLTKKEKSLLGLKIVVVSIVASIIAYIIAYFITSRIFTFVNFSYLFFSNVVLLNMFLLSVYLISIIFIMYNINRIKVKEVTDEPTI